MCGLTAIFETSPQAGQNLKDQLKRMNDAIAHRGPDHSGFWFDPDLSSLGLGHRRLAIVDLSPLGTQPMESPSGRYVTVYNGEIYNYRDLESDLKKLGHYFKGHSDTEIVLTAIEQWGLNRTLPKLAGMFAFVIWDKQEKILHLIRDRVGKKPLYIGWVGTALCMASELKPFLSNPNFKKEIDIYAMQSMIAKGYVEAPHSIFKSVMMLPAGTRMSLRLDNLKAGQDLKSYIETYWSVEDIIDQGQLSRAQSEKISDQDCLSEFSTLFEKSVSERMMADVPLGAFLSGGIDSSLVVAQMQALSEKPIETFSVGFDVEEKNEAPLAAKLAKHLKTNHHEIIIDAKKALAVVPLLPQIYDEPFADASQIPTYLMAQFAKEKVTVVLSGDGGDELAGGYRRHLQGANLWSILSKVPHFLRIKIVDILELLDDRDALKIKSFLPEKLSFLRQLLPAEDFFDFYELLLSQHSQNSLVLSPHIRNAQQERKEFLPASFAKLSSTEKMMAWDMKRYLTNDVLVKVDRATMAVALEARAPLLDHRLIEMMWGKSMHFKHRNGLGKWVLREKLREFVPSPLYQELFERPKAGFSPPIAQWLRQDLKDWAHDLLHPRRLKEQGFWDANEVQKMLADHQSGRRNHQDALWTVLQFQSWHQQYLEK